MMSYAAESVESGIIPFLSGIIHSFLFNNIPMVTLALILMEICCILARIKFIRHKNYIYPFRISLNIAASCLRILFTISLLVY
jgi:uncharacterized Tic20 family protein